MIFRALLAIWMAVIIVAAFLYAGAATGFPGETSRILFFHVPQAWVATLSFLLSMIASAVYLAKRNTTSDDMALSAAELGFLFCILATVTGSIFAKATWGSFWNWDPRETSIVILLMIYGAYFALRSAVPDPEKKRVFAGVYSILAFVTVPFLVFVVPRITASLHPEDTMNPANPGMDPKTLKVFLGSLLAYTALFVWMLRLKMRVLKIQHLQMKRSRDLASRTDNHTR
ncbi:MAG: cytochrome c biogenesis protein CcsA [Thermodesulfobacteriota bacterium]|nr:cytochrome c biogenesis protein CcsA [Thermodesulfobacteriota bacterium]